MKYYMCYFYDTNIQDNFIAGVEVDPKVCLDKSRTELIQFLKDNPEQLEEYPDNFIENIDGLLKVVECTKKLYDMFKDGNDKPNFAIVDGIGCYYIYLEHPSFGGERIDSDIGFDLIQDDDGTFYKLVKVGEKQ